MNKIKETDKAWTAGIIEGEGCLYINKKRRKTSYPFIYQSILYVSNTAYEMLKHLKEIWGGNIHNCKVRLGYKS